ncbi:MAG TPA: hypothetical protein VJA21_08515 [Verrucomicrobiae bacterium]
MANLEGITPPVGLNGQVKAPVEWDPDGPSGSFPNIMVIGGDFNQAPGLGSVPGLVGWDGTRFINIVGPNAVTYPKLLTTWDPDGPNTSTSPRLCRRC